MNIKSLWDKLKAYAKRHIFHMVMLAAIVVLGAAQFSQFAITGSMYGLIALNQQSFDTYAEKLVTDREKEKQELLSVIDTTARIALNNLYESKMELDSRIDILDSAIKPEKKRRMLIVKVRNAITENTDTKLSARELNNISIAIIDYSFQYNLSIAKVLAQMKAESDFVITAKSRAGAQGLMQIIPETWDYVILKEFNRKRADPYNIYHNIRAGCFYMSEQSHNFDTYDQALMAYNWGPHRVRRLLAGELTEDDIPTETINYVLSINEHTQTFESYGLG